MSSLMIKSTILSSVVHLLLRVACGYRMGDHEFSYLKRPENEVELQEWYKHYGPLYLELVIVTDSVMTTTLGGVKSVMSMGHAVARDLNRYTTGKRGAAEFTPPLHIFLVEVIPWTEDPITTDSSVVKRHEAFRVYMESMRRNYTLKYDVSLLIEGKPQVEPKEDYDPHAAQLCMEKVAVVRFPDDNGASHIKQLYITTAAGYALGRLLGMPEDTCHSGAGCQYIMAPAHPERVSHYSPVSIQGYRKSFLDLEKEENTVMSACVRNTPTASLSHPYDICGNGVVEKDEECDCLTYDQNCHKCCVNCKLVGRCYGGCCKDCNELTEAGVECRPPKDSCDKPEVCTAEKVCPADETIDDKTRCTTDSGKVGECHHGSCLSVADHSKDPNHNPETEPIIEGKKKERKWLIPIVVVSVIVALVLIALLVYCVVKRRKKGKKTVRPEQKMEGRNNATKI